MQARRKLCDDYGVDVLTEHCQNWFPKYRSGNFNLEATPSPARPLEADVDKIKSFVSKDCRKIISVKRDRSQPHLMSRINFQT